MGKHEKGLRADVEDLMRRWSADMVPTKGNAVTPRTITTTEAAGQLLAVLNGTYQHSGRLTDD